MANDLAILDTNMPAIPADIAKFFEDESNVAPKSTTPTLGITGKIWTIGLDGEKTKLMRRDKETGDESPLSVFRGVILDYAKRRGRAYYEGAYDPDNVAMPVCWSNDGVAPDQTVQKKQHPKCEGCPMNVKGSKVSDSNKAMKACGEHRMVAVVPAGKLDFTPLRLKLAITSDWDKERATDDGFMAFQQFTDMLRAKKVQHTAMIVTKMKFDPDVAYPKVLFAVDRWLDPQSEMPAILKVVKTEAVTSLLGGTYTPNGADGTPKQVTGTTSDVGNQADPAVVAAAEAKQKADLEAAAAAKATADKEAAKAARKAAKDKAAKEAAEAAAKAAAVAAADDDEEDEIQLPGTPSAGDTAKVVSPPAQTNGAAATPAKETAKAPTASVVTPDVSDLLAEWGDD